MFTKSKQEKSKTEKKGEKKRKVFEQLEVFIRLLGIIIDKNLNSMCHTEELRPLIKPSLYFEFNHILL